MKPIEFQVYGCIDGDVDHFWQGWVNFKAILFNATDMRTARREAAKYVNLLTQSGKLHLKYVRIIKVVQ